MPPSRSILLRAGSLLLLSLTLAACGAAAATAPAASAPATSSAASAPATSSATGAPVASAVPSAVAGGGIPDCSGGQIGRKAFKMFGLDAQHFCGPATATVTLAGSTVSIASGWCETNAAGFTVSIGTQIFGNPTAEQEPDSLIVLVDPTSGAGTISGVANHHNWLLTTSPVHYGAGKTSGTFSGTAIVGGAVSGSFICS